MLYLHNTNYIMKSRFFKAIRKINQSLFGEDERQRRFFCYQRMRKGGKKCPSFLHAPSADRNAAMQINAFLPNIKGMQSGTTQLRHSNRLFCNTFFATHCVSSKKYVCILRRYFAIAV